MRTIKGPFTLGAIYTNEELSGAHDDPRGKHIAIDASNHSMIATVVYKMCDDERNPELEAFAHRIVLCLNYLDGVPDEALVLKDQARHLKPKNYR